MLLDAFAKLRVMEGMSEPMGMVPNYKNMITYGREQEPTSPL